MSRESKLFTEEKFNIGKRIKEYESFGWELLSINGNDVSMSRETQNKVYSELIKFEYNYETLKEQQAALQAPIKPAKFSLANAVLGLIFFILPGLLYIAIKIIQNNKYELESQQYVNEYKRIEEEIKQVCIDSKSTFFSRQQ
jgi:hypothetical protein